MKATFKAIFASLLLATPAVHAIVLDFEQAVFTHGTVVNNQYNTAAFGNVIISAVNKDNGTNLAVVFDSNQTGTEDTDLQQPFDNLNNPLLPDNFNPGKILIVQEDGIGCSLTFCSSPDDEGTKPAGAITFNFLNPVNLISLDFFDIETAGENNNLPDSEIRFLDQMGNDMFANQFVPGTGGGTGNNDNTWDRLFFSGITGIYGLEVNLKGSGAIDRLEFNVVPIPASVWLFGTALVGFIGFARRRSI